MSSPFPSQFCEKLASFHPGPPHPPWRRGTSTESVKSFHPEQTLTDFLRCAKMTSRGKVLRLLLSKAPPPWSDNAADADKAPSAIDCFAMPWQHVDQMTIYGKFCCHCCLNWSGRFHCFRTISGRGIFAKSILDALPLSLVEYGLVTMYGGPFHKCFIGIQLTARNLTWESS